MNLLLKNISLPVADFSIEVDVALRSPVTAIGTPATLRKARTDAEDAMNEKRLSRLDIRMLNL